MISVDASMPRLVPGGTRLRVVETGFAGLQVSDEDKAVAVKENTEGWIDELGELREYAERPAA